MEKDYVITITIKNNILYSAMRKNGFNTALALSKESGVGQQTIGRYLNLKEVPLKKPYDENIFKDSILSISAALQCQPLDLFPPQHITKYLSKNKTTTTMDQADVINIINHSPSPLELIEFKDDEINFTKQISGALLTLTPREEMVIRHRFGIGYDEKTLKSIGVMLNICGNCVRIIEATALRKLRHPTRSNVLIKYSAYPAILQKKKRQREIEQSERMEENKNRRIH